MAKQYTLTLTDKQLELFTRLFSQAQGITPSVSSVKAESKPVVRDQHKAGKLAHKDVVEDIRLTAALLAIANWKKGSNNGGHFVYAKKAGRFTQQGVASVIWASEDFITVKSVWGNYRMENRKAETYSKTITEWDALREKYRPLVTSPKHAVL